MNDIKSARETKQVSEEYFAPVSFGVNHERGTVVGLALRIVGAIVFLYGVGYLVDGALFHLEYFIYADSTVNYYLVVGLLYCAAGAYLLRGAPHVVRFAYPQEKE